MQYKIADKFKNKEKALLRAKKLAKTNTYIAVIESRNEFFVENTPGIIRIWENLIWEKQKGD